MLFIPSNSNSGGCGHFLDNCIVAVSVIRLVFAKFAPFPLWLLGLTAVFLMREIHWELMSEGVYVGVIILLVIAWLQYLR